WNEDAAAEYESLVPAARATGVPELAVRALVGAGRTQMRLGALKQAMEHLSEARGIVETGSFSDLERSEVLYALGVCRYQLNSVQTALGLLNEALALAERSGMPSDQLRSNILSWRSRCWRRARAPARGRWERPAHDRRRVLPGLARRRPRGPLGARPQLRRARPRRVRRAFGQDPRRPADE